MSPTDDEQDDLLDRVTEMADRLKLDGSDRQQYIHEHMTRSGYRAEPHYVKDEPEEGEEESGKGGFFSSRDKGTGRDKGTRERGSSRDRGSGGEDWYK